MGQDEVSGKVRPGLVGENPLEEIEEILSQRTALYERACHYVVNTDQQSPDAVAQEIIQSLPEALTPVQDSGLPQGIVHTATLNP
jgi:shikimate kinase